MRKKQQLGQFFTKNTDYVLEGFGCYIKNKDVTDPFAGNGDLIKWALANGASSTIGFDIDNSLIDGVNIYKNDSLKNPGCYKFVLTNPPYLYQNKLKNNSILKSCKHTDLYQLALEKIMDSDEGIVIVPVNFLSAENSKYIRRLFFDKFEIVRVNYFSDRVFEDTSYNVISFYYRRKANICDEMDLDLYLYPAHVKKRLKIHKKHDWQIGGDFLALVNSYENRLHITRLEEEDLHNGNISINAAYNHLDVGRRFFVDEYTWNVINNNIVILKAIDTGAKEGKICLEDIRKYGYDTFVSIKTSRNQIGLVFPSFVSIKEQEQLIELFNDELTRQRNEYDSLFMTNYRDKDRKRISFNFAYNFINYLYFNKLKGENNGRDCA